MQSAKWYTEREIRRVRLYELIDDEPETKTDVVWRSLARQVIEKDSGTLGDYLLSLLTWDFEEMLITLDYEITSLNDAESRELERADSSEARS
jgi:hypothetical protein